jgi:hypothetical protein
MPDASVTRPGECRASDIQLPPSLAPRPQRTCALDSPTAGTWHVRIRTCSTFSGATLTPSYTP